MNFKLIDDKKVTGCIAEEDLRFLLQSKLKREPVKEKIPVFNGKLCGDCPFMCIYVNQKYDWPGQMICDRYSENKDVKLIMHTPTPAGNKRFYVRCQECLNEFGEV